MKKINQEMIVVLDLGGQYNQLITRKIRELGIYSELYSRKITVAEMKALNPRGIILSGGSTSSFSEGALTCDSGIFDLGIPILGICSGMNVLAEYCGGKVKENESIEYSEASITIEKESKLFHGLPMEQTVWMSHGDQVTTLPAGFVVNAKSSLSPIAAISNEDRQFYGVQFRPDVEQSEYGIPLLRNFAFDVCHCVGDWTMERFIEVETEKIRKQVGDKHVLCALSGGVDSSVVAVLLHKAIGDQLTCMFIDHGLLRKGEGESVMEAFSVGFNMNIIKIDAQDRFLNALKGISDPEQKRKIIGNEFIYVFEDESSKLKDMDFLAQGTLYTDIIESGTDTTATIKSHHNVGGLPEDMSFTLIEPLKALFKDEVRKVGSALGISDEIVWRQPFPGPGLGIRVLGEITDEKLEIVRESDAILRDEIKKAGLEREIWQYFTALPNMRSVGVKDELRTYDYTVGIRAVTSVDGMTSDWARIPWDVLEKISVRIVNEVKHVNRVVYDITSKPPSTIEWE